MPSKNSFVQELLTLTIKEQASDLHITAGHPPILRIAGRLIPLVKKERLTPEDTSDFAMNLMSEEQQTRFSKEKEIDLSYTFQSQARFRVNVFMQRGSISIALRLIPQKISTLEELNLPSVLNQFVKASQGFVLITGPSGHGKSTTLASLI